MPLKFLYCQTQYVYVVMKFEPPTE